MRDLAPSLATMVPLTVRRSQTVRQALLQRNWCRNIIGGMTVAAMSEFIHLWHALEGVQLSDASDCLRWRWTSDGAFSVRSAYEALHLPSQTLPWATLLWDTWAPLKTKLFLWLAFRRRHWTADRRRRHGWTRMIAAYSATRCQRPSTTSS